MIMNKKLVKIGEAAKFFDVVTYTGNGVAGRQIPHSLGVAPGMIFIKPTSTTGDWIVYHNSLSNDPTYGRYSLRLNTTDAQFLSGYTPAEPSASSFTVSGNNQVNMNGVSYVAYIFAHDPSADGIIQCGSFTTDGSGNATVNLGWEPQWVLDKSSSSAMDNWIIQDSMRSMTVTSGANLFANLPNAETNYSFGRIIPTATGFLANNHSSLVTYIYLAIRRPNKPPTSGTQVLSANTSQSVASAYSTVSTGFPVDLTIAATRSVKTGNFNFDGSQFFDRLRGATVVLRSNLTNGDVNVSLAAVQFDSSTNANLGYWGYQQNSASYDQISWNFRRSAGVFDVVCYTGTGVARTVSHNLGVAPELMIVKRRDVSSIWAVYHKNLTSYQYLLQLHLSDAALNYGTDGMFASTPTSSSFYVGADLSYSTNGTYVAYLFATKAGISKVGSYTGNGTSQTIDCGFTTGARFILIKRTDSTGDWYVWDSVRGIVAANDPHLSLNTTAAEVTTDDSIDPDSSGFIVNQVSATNINVSSATYIFLSFA